MLGLLCSTAVARPSCAVQQGRTPLLYVLPCLALPSPQEETRVLREVQTLYLRAVQAVQQALAGGSGGADSEHLSRLRQLAGAGHSGAAVWALAKVRASMCSGRLGKCRCSLMGH